MSDEQDEAARARALILQRRNRFIAAAIAGLGATQSACSDSHGSDGQQVIDGGGSGGRGGEGARPSVCLSGQGAVGGTFEGGTGGVSGAGTGAVGGAGKGGTGTGGAGTGGAGTGGTAGSEPRVCLDIGPTCRPGQPPPCVCLTAPIDEDAGT